MDESTGLSLSTCGAKGQSRSCARRVPEEEEGGGGGGRGDMADAVVSVAAHRWKMETDQGMKRFEEEEEEEENHLTPPSSLSQAPLFSVFESEEEGDCVDGGLDVGFLDGSNTVVTTVVAAAVTHHHSVDVQIAECFEFVSTSSGCLDRCEHGGVVQCDDIDVSECLDFVQAESECLDSPNGEGRGGGGEGVVVVDDDDARLGGGFDGESMSQQCVMDFCKSESLDSFDGQKGYNIDAVEVAGSESLDSGVAVVHGRVVDEVEALLFCDVAKSTTTTAGEAVSGSDSGECSSGEKKEERNHHRKGGSKNATTAGGKKKAKVDWTPELHRRFVQAVEQLGVEKAFPSRILELMGVQCLTRHNIASHLQKYRSHRRHLAAREAEAASWSHNRRPYTHPSWSRSRRTEGLPYLVPIHSNTPPIQPRPSTIVSHAHHQMQQQQPLRTPLKVWGYPTVDHSPVHMWQQSPMSPPSFWQAPDGSYWQHPAACYDASHPAQPPPCYPHPMRVPLATMPCSSTGAAALLQGFSEDSFFADEALPSSMYLCNNSSYESDIGTAAGAAACSTPSESTVSKEILHAAISEALANPWTPPPLGLKPPSMEGVIAELQRQGINTVPPSTC